jgi:hypothetical protein
MTLNDFIRLHLDLINLTNNEKKCRECLNKECKKEASFNFKYYTNINIRKNIYCKSHKLTNMVDIKSKKCIKCNIKIPIFKYKDEKKALYCKGCSTPDMIDIKNKKCIKCNDKIPNFNNIGEKKAKYCYDCKTPEMIDVKHKNCIACNNTRPSFNLNLQDAPELESLKLLNLLNKSSKI